MTDGWKNLRDLYSVLWEDSDARIYVRARDYGARSSSCSVVGIIFREAKSVSFVSGYEMVGG